MELTVQIFDGTELSEEKVYVAEYDQEVWQAGRHVTLTHAQYNIIGWLKGAIPDSITYLLEPAHLPLEGTRNELKLETTNL